MYQPYYLSVREIAVTLSVRHKGRKFTQTIAMEPKGLQIESGVEDIYEALEFRYGWERFERQIAKLLVSTLGFEPQAFEIEEIDMTKVSEEEQELEDARAFLAEHFPEELEL